ncbi:MAG: protease modulator HflC [Bradymonadia bacterium]
MKRYIALALVALIAVVGSQSLYVITETEQVVVTEFGKPISTQTDAGIHFKMPWHTARYFDKRYIRWDGSKSQVTTRDKKYIEVDTTARWRVVDPLKFLESVRDASGAQSRLDDLLDSQVRDIITNNDLIELVRSDRENRVVGRIQEERARLEEQSIGTEGDDINSEDDLLYRIKFGRESIQRLITDSAQKTARDEYGIEVIDVRIKRINYVDEVQADIYKRMVSERNKIAEKYRSQGLGQKARISGEMKNRLRVISSTAERKARQIEGEGDAVAARIYARAFDVDPEFYSFYQTLQSYESSLKGRIRPVFTIDNEYFKYLKARGQTGLTEAQRQRRLGEVQETLKAIETLGEQYGGGGREVEAGSDEVPGELAPTKPAAPKAPPVEKTPKDTAPTNNAPTNNAPTNNVPAAPSPAEQPRPAGQPPAEAPAP